MPQDTPSTSLTQNLNPHVCNTTLTRSFIVPNTLQTSMAFLFGFRSWNPFVPSLRLVDSTYLLTQKFSYERATPAPHSRQSSTHQYTKFGCCAGYGGMRKQREHNERELAFIRSTSRWVTVGACWRNGRHAGAGGQEVDFRRSSWFGYDHNRNACRLGNLVGGKRTPGGRDKKFGGAPAPLS